MKQNMSDFTGFESLIGDWKRSMGNKILKTQEETDIFKYGF